jgi:cysteine synthase A
MTSLVARPEIADSVLGLVGATPLVRLNRVIPQGAAQVLGKMENLNPGGSVKDRIALAMIEDAERKGTLAAGATIVEPTSGNTGIGLALVAAVKGYRLILTPAIEGMTGAVFAANQLVEKNAGYFMPQQFENAANPEVHYRTTGREILNATGGRIDAFVAGVGTGGTITGVGRALREEAGDAVQLIAVEPARSPVLSGGRAGMHGIQGIGASFVPGVLDRTLYNEVMRIEDKDAVAMTRRLAREEGILAGISSGANVFAARKIAERLGEGKVVVTIISDTGERYLSVNM